MTISKLAELAKTNAKVKSVLKHLATRDRNPKDGIEDIRRTKTTVRDKFKMNLTVPEFEDIYGYFEKAGAGKRMYDDEGRFTHFEWRENMKSFASKALNGDGGRPGLPVRMSFEPTLEPSEDLVFKIMSELNRALPLLKPEEVALLKTFIETKTSSR